MQQERRPLPFIEHGTHLSRDAGLGCTDKGAPPLMRTLARHATPCKQTPTTPERREHALGAPAFRG